MTSDSDKDRKNLTTYKNSLMMAWSDGLLVEQELAILDDLRQRMELSREEHLAVEGLVFLELGRKCEAAGDTEGAMTWYEKIAENESPFEEAWKARGLFLAGQGKYQLSREALEKAEVLHTEGSVIDLEAQTVSVPDDSGGAGEDEEAEEVWSIEGGGTAVEEDIDVDDIWDEEPEEEEMETLAEMEEEDEGATFEEVEDEDEGVPGTGIMDCPKCDEAIAVLSPERPIIVTCPGCGAKGRISIPGIPGGDEAPYGVKECPKCAQEIAIPSNERPIILECASCGSRGRLKE